MPHYKSGYWVRVFLEAPNLEAALRAPVRLHCSNDVPEHEGALAGFVDGVSVEEVEVEHEHTSVFDDEGREIERYDADGKLIDPCDSSEEEGDSYVNAGLQQWMVELLTRQVMKGENRCQMSEYDGFYVALDRCISGHEQRPVMKIADALDDFSVSAPPVAGIYTVHISGRPHWSQGTEDLREAIALLPQHNTVQYSPAMIEAAVPAAMLMNKRIGT